MAIFGDFISGLLEFLYIVAILYVVGAIFIIIKNHLVMPVYEGAVNTGRKLSQRKDQTQAEAVSSDARVQDLQRQLQQSLAQNQEVEKKRRELETRFDQEKVNFAEASRTIINLQQRLQAIELRIGVLEQEKEALETQLEQKGEFAGGRAQQIKDLQQQLLEQKRQQRELKQQLEQGGTPAQRAQVKATIDKLELEKAELERQRWDLEGELEQYGTPAQQATLRTGLAEIDRLDREKVLLKQQRDELQRRINEEQAKVSERIAALEAQVSTVQEMSKEQVAEREKIRTELDKEKKHKEELAQELKELKEKIIENEDKTQEILQTETGDMRKLLSSLRRPIYSSIRASKKAVKSIDDAIDYAQKDKYNKMDEELLLVNLRMSDIQDEDSYINDLSNKIQQLNTDLGGLRPEISIKIRSLKNLLIKEIDNVRTRVAQALAKKSTLTPPVNKGAFLSILGSVKTSLDNIQEELNGLHALLKEETNS